MLSRAQIRTLIYIEDEEAERGAAIAALAIARLDHEATEREAEEAEREATEADRVCTGCGRRLARGKHLIIKHCSVSECPHK